MRSALIRGKEGEKVKVMINGYSFKVRFIDGKKKKMNPKKNHYNFGLIEYMNGVINIRKGLNHQTTRTTVIHELTHAFMFAFGYTIEGEEAMCDFFSAQGDAIIRLANEIMERGAEPC